MRGILISGDLLRNGWGFWIGFLIHVSNWTGTLRDEEVGRRSRETALKDKKLKIHDKKQNYA